MQVFVEEYLGLFSDIQGNVNVLGLVFDSVVDSELGVDVAIHTVNVDEICDTFGISSDFFPYHLPNVISSLALACDIGSGPQARVFGFDVDTIYKQTDFAPVDVWWFGANLVHGPDTFYEEIYSNLYADVSRCDSAPHYYETSFDSFGIEFSNMQPHPGVHIAFKFSVANLFNMRHATDPEYIFNSTSVERFSVFDRDAFGHGKLATSTVGLQDFTYRILGSSVDEHFSLADRQFFLESFHVAEKLVLSAAPLYMREFLEAVDDFYSMDADSVEDFWLIHSVVEQLEVRDPISGVAARQMLASDIIRTVATLGVLHHNYPTVSDAIEVDLETGVAHLVRDGADSDLGFADEVTDG